MIYTQFFCWASTLFFSPTCHFHKIEAIDSFKLFFIVNCDIPTADKSDPLKAVFPQRSDSYRVHKFLCGVKARISCFRPSCWLLIQTMFPQLKVLFTSTGVQGMLERKDFGYYWHGYSISGSGCWQNTSAYCKFCPYQGSYNIFWHFESSNTWKHRAWRFICFSDSFDSWIENIITLRNWGL